MVDNIQKDLIEVTEKLNEYINKGRVMRYPEIRREPMIAVKPDMVKIKPLRKVKNCDANFMAVDCSTRTLKRANNWGIYLLRTAYTFIKNRSVNWGYEEKICTEIGDAPTRRDALVHRRMELESRMALSFLCEEHAETEDGAPLTLDSGDYVLLDGASFFGRKKGFWTSLYEESLRKNINLLCISKQSSTLHDEKGRDLIATICAFSPHSIWVYHPVKEADKNKHRYGDISIIKLCEESVRAFRCDIMDYLSEREIIELLSPLTFISEDPRCLGYPVVLWLAHKFSTPSDAKLLHYHDQVEKMLEDAGLLEMLRMEEVSCNFSDELHGVKHPFQLEWIERV